MIPSPYFGEFREGVSRRTLRCMHDSRLLRYGVAIFLALLAGLFTMKRGVMLETPFFLFLGAVVLSAIYGGIGPAFLTIVLSLVLMRGMFPPGLARYLGEHPERIQKLAGFVLVTLMAGSLVAALRRERNLLRESEDLYREIVEHGCEAVMLIDEAGDVAWANRAAEKIFAKGSALTGTPIGSVLPREIWESELAAIKGCEALDEASAQQITLTDGREDPLALEVTFRGLQKNGEDVLGIIVHDVTHYIHPQRRRRAVDLQ
jgi:PAS domain S-box-containing protein